MKLTIEQIEEVRESISLQKVDEVCGRGRTIVDDEVLNALCEAAERTRVSALPSEPPKLRLIKNRHGATPKKEPEKVWTGLCDSRGKKIHVGDLIRKEVTINQEFHGEWAHYRVKQQGLTPILSYVRSEKGPVLPEGYLATTLSSQYDGKNFLWATKPERLRPVEGDLAVVVEMPAEEPEGCGCTNQNRDMNCKLHN